MWCGVRGTLKGMPMQWGFPLYRCYGSLWFRKANPMTQSAICGVERETIHAPQGNNKCLLLLILIYIRENLRKSCNNLWHFHSNVIFAVLCFIVLIVSWVIKFALLWEERSTLMRSTCYRLQFVWNKSEKIRLRAYLKVTVFKRLCWETIIFFIN